MIRRLGLALVLGLSACAGDGLQTVPSAEAAQIGATLFPASGAANVNPDTHLVLSFASPPTVDETGKIRIYDAADNSLADELDLAIPTSPNPSGRGAAQTAGQELPPGAVQAPVYQVTKVGGADYHFRPIIVRDNKATIYPHNNALKYGRTYIVKLDGAVLKPATGAFPGVSDWKFSTKPAPPAATAKRVTVSADGKGDFSTLQAAIEFFPAKSDSRREIFIRNGNYEEIIYFADRSNLTIRGESRDKTIVGYANNTPFAQGAGKR
ncbi:MAG TPA: pectinesterase family protein [Hyphomonadaceae bacterium]|jgi:hypothetical protein|nr:pectinesterase family protein [Hyphomonadaceae bacterium]